jgi:hypothetical protein
VNPFISKNAAFRFALFPKASAFVLLFVFGFSFAQQQFILKDAETQKEFIKKDSLSAAKFLDSLVENNYYFARILNVEKQNETTKIIFDKGKNFNEAQVKIAEEVAENLKMKPEFFTKNLDSLKKIINQKYIGKGYAFSRVKTKYLGMKNEIPQVEISVNANQQRKINGFVVRGYEKVPKRFIKNFEKEFNGKDYSDKNLIAINQSLQNHPFVLLEHPPQTLFTKDSTNIYLFLQKKKANSFDGIIGFGNDKSKKFTLNGTLNVSFGNMFNAFEQLSLYWQRNPDKGQTFDLKADVPYFLGSNAGMNVNVNIFRQDSTYANVKFIPSVYLHLSNTQKAGIRGTFEKSTVLDSLFTSAKDFSKSGIGVWYNFTEPTEIELFRFKTSVDLETDFFRTIYGGTLENVSQIRYFANAERNFNVTGNHYLNLKGESAMLNSKAEIYTNELFRIGGWNSIRGFNEASLLGDFYFFGNAEYRYLINNQAFFDVFTQYGQIHNKSLNATTKLYSFGFGFNFFLPIGLMSFQLSNGNQFGNPIKFSDTKVHWGILARF